MLVLCKNNEILVSDGLDLYHKGTNIRLKNCLYPL